MGGPMNAEKRRVSELRKALSDCIGQASNLGGVEDRRAMQQLVAFLYAAQDTLDRISPEPAFIPSIAVGGLVDKTGG
jgi:hypothetical protein